MMNIFRVLATLSKLAPSIEAEITQLIDIFRSHHDPAVQKHADTLADQLNTTEANSQAP